MSSTHYLTPELMCELLGIDIPVVLSVARRIIVGLEYSGPRPLWRKILRLRDRYTSQRMAGLLYVCSVALDEGIPDSRIYDILRRYR